MLPTKTEIITGLVLSAIGGLIVALSTDFASFGWYLMLLGIAVYLLPGPQIRHFFRQRHVYGKTPERPVSRV